MNLLRKLFLLAFALLLMGAGSNSFGQSTFPTGSPKQVFHNKGGYSNDSADQLPRGFAIYPNTDSSGRICFDSVTTKHVWYHTGVRWIEMVPKQYIDSAINAGGGSMKIGNPVTSGSDNDVLFIQDGNLGQDDNFNYVQGNGLSIIGDGTFIGNYSMDQSSVAYIGNNLSNAQVGAEDNSGAWQIDVNDIDGGAIFNNIVTAPVYINYDGDNNITTEIESGNIQINDAERTTGIQLLAQGDLSSTSIEWFSPSASTTVIADLSSNTIILNTPDKPSGGYTIATTDDISGGGPGGNSGDIQTNDGAGGFFGSDDLRVDGSLKLTGLNFNMYNVGNDLIAVVEDVGYATVMSATRASNFFAAFQAADVPQLTGLYFNNPAIGQEFTMVLSESPTICTINAFLPTYINDSAAIAIDGLGTLDWYINSVTGTIQNVGSGTNKFDWRAQDGTPALLSDLTNSLFSDAVVNVPDADYIITGTEQVLLLHSPTSNRNLTLPTGIIGHTIKVSNPNSGSFHWAFAGGNVISTNSGVVTTLADNTSYILEYVAASTWLKVN